MGVCLSVPLPAFLSLTLPLYLSLYLTDTQSPCLSFCWLTLFFSLSLSAADGVPVQKDGEQVRHPLVA